MMEIDKSRVGLNYKFIDISINNNNSNDTTEFLHSDLRLFPFQGTKEQYT